jgi:hypothetical protein
VIRILTTHKYDSVHSADDIYIARDIQVTRVKYNQYTSCRLKVLAKWMKICRVIIRHPAAFTIGTLMINFIKFKRNFETLMNLF